MHKIQQKNVRQLVQMDMPIGKEEFVLKYALAKMVILMEMECLVLLTIL